MTVSCCVINCTNRFKKGSGINFLRIPEKEPKRTAWENAICRKKWKPNRHSRVCSIHFLTGKTSDDPTDPDYIPHLYMGHDEESALNKSFEKKKRSTRRKRRDERKKNAEEARVNEENERVAAAEILLNFAAAQLDEPQPDQQQDDHDEGDQELPDVALRYLELKKENSQLYAEVRRLQEENQKLKEDLRNSRFNVDFLKHGNGIARTKFFTGFPNYEVFAWALALCAPMLPTSKTMSPGNILLLILMKLRLGLVSQDLAYRFNISCSTVSRLLNVGLPAIARQLCFLVRWPQKDEILRTLPSVFKPTYKNCRVIIDCTEIFCERGRNLTLRALTWSNYKHHNTLKVLVGITPTGGVSFISRAFGGRVSDKVITQKSGFLDMLEYGDQVLADRGFLIEEELASRGARLAIPSFTRGLKQLSMKSIEQSRRLARVRIHVERMMERLKNFRIIAGILPLSLVLHADNILMICSAISNLQPRLVK